MDYHKENIRLEFLPPLMVLMLLCLCSAGAKAVNKQVDEVSITFLGQRVGNDIDSVGNSERSESPHPIEDMWTTEIKDSAFINSLLKFKEWKSAPVYYCARNVRIFILYKGGLVDTLKASIYEDCPFIEYNSKGEVKSKYFDKTVLVFLQKLLESIPEKDGWEKL